MAAYADLVPDVREALGVGSAKDSVVQAGLERNARYLLRNYNFPESLTYYASSTLADSATGFALPVAPAAVGKIKAVRLKLTSESPPLYKRLRRREESVLPTEGGPIYWYRLGANIAFDTPLVRNPVSETYVGELWYQTVSIATAESWLSDTYRDCLFHRTAYELAPLLRKPEAQQVFSALWQEDQVILASYLNELEFQDLDLRLGEHEVPALIERYPAHS